MITNIIDKGGTLMAVKNIVILENEERNCDTCEDIAYAIVELKHTDLELSQCTECFQGWLRLSKVKFED